MLAETEMSVMLARPAYEKHLGCVGQGPKA